MSIETVSRILVDLSNIVASLMAVYVSLMAAKGRLVLVGGRLILIFLLLLLWPAILAPFWVVLYQHASSSDNRVYWYCLAAIVFSGLILRWTNSLRYYVFASDWKELGDALEGENNRAAGGGDSVKGGGSTWVASGRQSAQQGAQQSAQERPTVESYFLGSLVREPSDDGSFLRSLRKVIKSTKLRHKQRLLGLVAAVAALVNLIYSVADALSTL